MPKGQFPKIKGAICNIPVQTENVCNILPRGIDSSGLVFVQLKRKMSYKWHVYSEGVRPQILHAMLQYLKENNSLYSDVVIDMQPINSETAQDDVTLDYINENTVDFIVNESHMFTENSIDIKFVDESSSSIELISDFEDKNDEFENDDPLNEFRSAANETALLDHATRRVVILTR